MTLSAGRERPKSDDRDFGLKKFVRTLQTRLPFLLEAKVEAQRIARSALQIPSERTYRLFKHFPFRSGQVFVDVGANRGQTIASFRLWRKDVPVVSFEPNVGLASRLVKRYGDDSNLTVHAVGLADKAGGFTLHVPSYRKFRFDGLASLDLDAARNWLGPETIFGFDAALLTIDSQACLVKRMDDFDLDPGLIKIDVQGYEIEVLKGGAETIRKSRPTFIIENDEEGMRHADHLASMDYVTAEYDHGRMEVGRPGRRNSVYIPKEKLDSMLALFR